MNGIIIQQNVVYKTDKGTPVTDSLKVAEVFGKEHKSIIRAIRNILGRHKIAPTANGSMNQPTTIHKASNSRCL